MRSNTIIARKRDGATARPEPHALSLRRLVVLAILSVAVGALLVSLGNWQVRRLAWKEDLIASTIERPAMPALDFRKGSARALAADPAFADAYQYRRIVLEGDYLADKEAQVFTSLPADDAKGAASGPGTWIMTPFRLADASDIIWVNRGFVPQDRDWSPAPAGRVTITGLVRPDDPPGWLTPADAPEKNLFFARSIAALSSAKDLPSVAGLRFTIDLAAENAPSLPQAGETRMTFTNNHLQYAVTWYGLAAALLAVFSVLSWRALRGSDEKAA